MKRKLSRVLWILVLLISLAAVGVSAWLLLSPRQTEDLSQFHTQPTVPVPATAQPPAQQPTQPPVETTQPPVETTEPLPDNPIDFAALTAQNEDIYAWIEVPGTGIDLPVFQAAWEADDNFYLHHDINGNYDFKGCIYTQKANAKDFSDPVTLVYGHNMLDGTMFSNLVDFRDKQYFADHDRFYIYTPGHILTYEIVSAHQYDDRHILNSFDFSQKAVFQEYIDYLLAPKTMVANVREGVEVTTDDRIVTLSTCLEHGAVRYLIQGVLIDDQPTN